jgi:hypothetical protein
LFYLGSCKHKSDHSEILTISVDVDTKGEIVKLSEVASDVKYIKLETRPDFLLGQIQRYIISDKIYIMQSTKINVFDLSGKALYEIDHLNQKGPAGYRTISDFRIDTVNNIVALWDRYQRKMIKYSSQNGQFFNYKHIQVFATSFFKSNDESYFFYSNYHPNVRYFKNNLYQIFLFDKNGILLTKFINEPINKHTGGKPLDDFCFYDGKLLISPCGNNSVYQIDKKNCIEVLRLDFGKNQLMDEYFVDRKKGGWEGVLKSEYACHLGGVQENQWLYKFKFMYKTKSFESLYSKTTGKAIKINHFINDFDGNYKMTFDIKNNMYSKLLTSFYLKRCYLEIQNNMDKNDWDKFRSKHAEFSRICENSTDNDNPILLIMTPKKF